MTVSGTPAIDLCDPSKSAIRRDLEEALLHGPMEVDDKGRINCYATSSRSSLRQSIGPYGRRRLGSQPSLEPVRERLSRGEPSATQLTYSRVIDPRLCCDQVHREAKPERDAEEFRRSEARETSSREERTNDGADGSDSQSQGERANHSFTMQCHMSSTDTGERSSKSDQEEDAKERRCGSLRGAADRHLCGHRERGHAGQQTGRQHDVADPPMHPGSPDSKCLHELERPKHHEDQPRKDVEHRQWRILCERRVERRGSRKGRRRGNQAEQTWSSVHDHCDAD
jgi:hypothetical protein